MVRVVLLLLLAAGPAWGQSKLPRGGPLSGRGYIKVAVTRALVGEAKDDTLTIRIPYVKPSTNRGRGRNRRPQPGKVEYKDYDLTVLPDTGIRRMKLPPKILPNGKKGKYTREELRKLKGNSRLPGYPAELAELAPQTVVEVTIVRERGDKGPGAKLFAKLIKILK